MLSLMQVKHCKVDHQSLLIDLKSKESWSSKASDFQTKGLPEDATLFHETRDSFFNAV